MGQSGVFASKLHHCSESQHWCGCSHKSLPKGNLKTSIPEETLLAIPDSVISLFFRMENFSLIAWSSECMYSKTLDNVSLAFRLSKGSTLFWLHSKSQSTRVFFLPGKHQIKSTGNNNILCANILGILRILNTHVCTYTDYTGGLGSIQRYDMPTFSLPGKCNGIGVYREFSHSIISVLLDIHERTPEFKLLNTAIFCSIQMCKALWLRSETFQRAWVKSLGQEKANVKNKMSR